MQTPEESHVRECADLGAQMALMEALQKSTVEECEALKQQRDAEAKELGLVNRVVPRAQLDDAVMLVAVERRALPCRAARHQRGAAAFDLPVDQPAERGFVQRPIAKRSHQSGNRA